jgi:hypothetical protein
MVHAHRRRPARHADPTTCCWSPTSPGCRHFGPADAVSEARVRWRRIPMSPLARQRWAQRLPPACCCARPTTTARVSNLSRAYRVNLNVLALVALLTGAFLVFATQLTAVAQRSTQFALLGVLGLSPRMRLLQVLLEGPGDRRARRAARPGSRLRAGAGLHPAAGRRSRRRLFLRPARPADRPATRCRRWLSSPWAAPPASPARSIRPT